MASVDLAKSHKRPIGLAIAALGVVYGDIGTSPLYAFREALAPEHGIMTTAANVNGVLSLIIWSLLIIITIKYILLVMRADNHGEGGILALASLLRSDSASRWRRWLFVLGLFGTALLYGDGAITPAISVLSAVEGLEVATPIFAPYVVPISVVILIVLFSVQWRGTGSIGRVFGWIMLLWFGILALLGVVHILDAPEVLAAFNPANAVGYFADNGYLAFKSLGSVFLVVTGGEALYADMGHFGRGPIRFGWFSLVMPALVLTYLGQGALLIADPTAIDNPFYRMAPEWGLLPLVVLATVATVIASQALISGAFSLTMQAIQLDYLPRMRIRHTSTEEAGQIYLPAVNWALMAACVGLVVTFGSSSSLAAAYGVAVTATMVITTLIFTTVVVDRFGWRPATAAAMAVVLLSAEVGFLGANLLKIPAGGWFPLVLAALIFFVMNTWRAGRRLVATNIRRGKVPLLALFKTWDEDPLPRVPGTALYLFPEPGVAPPALLTNIRANHSLHESTMLLSVVVEDRPRVPPAARSRVQALEHGFTQIVMSFGFSEHPDIISALKQLDDPIYVPEDTVFVLGRETIRPTARRYSLSRLRERLFARLHRNATDAALHFRLPPERVIEIGRVVEI